MRKLTITLFLLTLSLFLNACEEVTKPTLDFDTYNIAINVGYDFTISPIVNDDKHQVVYTINDQNILTYEDGKFIALQQGSAMIIASIDGYPSIRRYIFVTCIPNEVFYIKYVINGGTININSPITFSEDQLPLTLPILKKDNHQFDGWYKTDDFSGTSITYIPENTKTNLKLYANWILIE